MVLTPCMVLFVGKVGGHLEEQLVSVYRREVRGSESWGSSCFCFLGVLQTTSLHCMLGSRFQSYYCFPLLQPLRSKVTCQHHTQPIFSACTCLLGFSQAKEANLRGQICSGLASPRTAQCFCLLLVLTPNPKFLHKCLAQCAL